MSTTMQRMADRARQRVLASRLDGMDRENDKLRAELKLVRQQLDHERTEQDELRDTLRESVRTKPVKIKRRSRPIRLLLVGGGAYIFGTRAGREQYDRIAAWARTQREHLRNKAEDVGDVVGTTAEDALASVKGGSSPTSRTA